jgi:uncharacterized protein
VITTATVQEQRTLSRRQFLQFSALAAGGGLVVYSGMWDRHHLEVCEQTIRLRRLPEAFHGLRIAQISDIHYDEFTEPYFVREVVGRINAAHPDIVLLTGDFVTGGGVFPHSIEVRTCYPCAEILGGIQCPHRFASLGNHDTLVGWEIMVDALKMRGIPTLVNGYFPFERDGSRLWFAGLRSSLEDVPDLNTAIPRQAAPGEPIILLAHEPDYALEVVKRTPQVDLMLSGHTHGGQIHLPLVGTPRPMLPRLGRRFIQGHFNLGPLQLYVNRGIGTVKLPMRFLCPPELTLITLQPA